MILCEKRINSFVVDPSTVYFHENFLKICKDAEETEKLVRWSYYVSDILIEN